MTVKIIRILVLLTFLQLVAAPLLSAQPTIRVGYFTNFTHAQALVGKSTGRFAEETGARIEWKAFNAGPSAMEALIAGSLDMAYVGPNPALNAYVRSKGSALRIIAGAADGGAGLVVRRDMKLQSPQDLKGKRVAAPELGNTQDVALRHWLGSQKLSAGDVRVRTMKNADILALFRQKELDAAWVPEPWLTRLLHEGNGRLYLDERAIWPSRRFPTAVLVVRQDFLKSNRAVVKRFVRSHVDATEWIRANRDKAIQVINDELGRHFRLAQPRELLAEAFTRTVVTYNPYPDALSVQAGNALAVGYLPAGIDCRTLLQGAVDLALLNEILAEQRKPGIK